MTGGTPLAGDINRNLARACREFGLGMGLGSCRIILEDDRHLDGFDVREVIGNDLPLWANLGISQVESLVDRNEVAKAADLVRRLRADGLIIHVNPMQEFFQPEGDVLRHAPIETIRRFLEQFHHPVIVKEVGQGMGPKSMRALLQLPIQAIEFAAFGGTNFARLELMRDETGQSSVFAPLAAIGENAFDMLDQLNAIAAEGETACREVIVSGGIRSFLDGYYVISKSSLPAIYGMASGFLKHAWGPYEELQRFVREQIQGLEMAQAYLTLRS
jgi:isopentenyl-diphosphate Delta-isomerase